MTGSKKENGISISDVERRFLALSQAWEERTGIRVQLAKVFGNRWSYVAGPLPGKDSVQPVKRFHLRAAYGLLVYCPEGQEMDEEEMKRDFGEVLH